MRKISSLLNRVQNGSLRRMGKLHQSIALFAVSFCLIAACSIALCSFYSNAKSGAEEGRRKYYKSITIEENDTLWFIAKKYMDQEHYDSIPAYISEVMQINGLPNDTIYADSRLIVPYYKDADFTLDR